MRRVSICILFVTTLLTSCNTNDDSGNATNDSIPSKVVGLWNLTNMIVDGVPLSDDSCSLQNMLSIGQDGSYTLQTYSGTPGDCTANTVIPGTWSVNKDVLTLAPTKPTNLENPNTVFNIASLTDDSLKVESSENDIDGTGQPISTTEVCFFSKV